MTKFFKRLLVFPFFLSLVMAEVFCWVITDDQIRWKKFNIVVCLAKWVNK
jgi:hypothetical protein